MTGRLTGAASQRSDKSETRDVRSSPSSTGPPRPPSRWLIPAVVVAVVAIGIGAFASLGGGGGNVSTTTSSATATTGVTPTTSVDVPVTVDQSDTTAGAENPPTLSGFEGDYIFTSEDMVVLNTSGVLTDAEITIEMDGGGTVTVSYVNAGALREGSFQSPINGQGDIVGCGVDSCVLTAVDGFPQAVAMTADGLRVLNFTTMEPRSEFCGFAVRPNEGLIEPTYGPDGTTVESFRYLTSFGTGTGDGVDCEDAVELSFVRVGTRVP